MSTELITATESATRCGFEALAEPINEAHRLARSHAESALEQALRAGELLLAAKAQAPRGSWLRLRANVEFSERTCQAYMRLAMKRERVLEHASDAEDGLSVRRALEHVSRPLSKDDHKPEARQDGDAEADDVRSLLYDTFGGDALALGEHLLERPFCALDLASPHRVRWFASKLLHQTEVPALAGFALDHEHEDIAMLRLAPGAELVEALDKLHRLAQGKGTLRLDARSLAEASHIGVLAQLEAARMCGRILVELDHREDIDDETYAAEHEEVRQQFLAACEARLKALDEVQERHARGEFDNDDAYGAALEEIAP